MTLACHHEHRITHAELPVFQGVSTIEYLQDPTTSDFYFIEMNIRVQVKHPVTEMITGVDIVRESLQLVSGESLQHSQSNITLRGVAIEYLISPEDPQQNFMPAPGKISALRLPSGPGVRIDTHLNEGYSVSPYYDSPLAKVIV